MFFPEITSPHWSKYLAPEFTKPYMKTLSAYLQEQSDKEIYPAKENWFKALNDVDFDDVKIVILGQDPYHGQGQAMGYSFSVPEDVKTPPSLRNIQKELEQEFETSLTPMRDLTSWVDQGVLLLNATLTVEAQKAGSHQKQGWENFTDQIIHLLNEKRENLVFLLWGAFAQKKGAFIDRSRHLVLESVHPSPLSASRGFFGCQHFIQANKYLEQHGNKPIDFVGAYQSPVELTLF